MKSPAFLCLVVLVCFASKTSADLVSSFSVGDISIIGYSSDAPDSIAFVTWKDIDANESVFFTDSGFFDDGTLRSTEEEMDWTNDTGGSIVAGTVIVWATNGGADLGSTIGGLSFLSTFGDQVFVGKSGFPGLGDSVKPGSFYAGSDLLFGIDTDGDAGWASDATSSTSSALPSELNVANGNFAVAESTFLDNGQYTGARTGLTIAQFQAALADSSNWTFSDSNIALSSTDFSIVPEPGSLLLGALACLGMTVRRRRMS